MEVMTTHNRCEDHQKIVGDYEKLKEDFHRLELKLAGIDKDKASVEDLNKLKEKSDNIEKTIIKMETLLSEIKENSSEDRQSIRDLTVGLNLISDRLNGFETMFKQLEVNSSKIDEFIFEYKNGVGYQFSKTLKSISGILSLIKSKNILLKYIVSVIQYGVIIYALWIILAFGMFLTKQTVDTNKIFELFTLYLQKG